MARNLTIDDLNSVLTSRLADLETRITVTLTEKITESIGRLWSERIQQNERDIEANAAAITQLTTRVKSLEDETVKGDVVKQLSDELDDLRNRNMRNNLVIKGMPESDGPEKENTRNIVILHLADLTGENVDELEHIVDRCHRGGKTDPNNRRPRNIYMNLSASRHVDNFIDAARERRSPYKHERQYTKAINDRRNAAMMERKRLKDNKLIVSGYVDYPAKLMVKKPGAKKYTLENEF